MSCFMYDIFYHEIEINHIITLISSIFYDNLLYNRDYLIDYITSSYPGIEKKFIHLALEKMVNERILFISKFKTYGYLQYNANHYIFHPNLINYNITTPINLRGPGVLDMPNSLDNLTDLINESIDVGRDHVDKTLEELISDVSDLLDDAFNIESYINSLSLSEKIIILENAISEWNTRNTNIDHGSYNILLYFKYYLIDKNSIKRNRFIYNHNHDDYFTYYSRDDVKKDKDRKFIGHILTDIPKVMEQDSTFEYKKSSSVIDTVTILPENGYITGKYTKDFNGSLIFKLKYTSNFSDSEDKRKLLKGFKCTQINNKAKVFEIYKNIVGDNSLEINQKININTYCNMIESELRKKQYENQNIRWVYDYSI